MGGGVGKGNGGRNWEGGLGGGMGVELSMARTISVV